ncbi:hypothetical protein B9Z55_009355 [Caenorhabditis nigoni]|nr:hypothetical protein B9Z55_009355 [Caenorhabditis nigoni]
MYRRRRKVQHCEETDIKRKDNERQEISSRHHSVQTIDNFANSLFLILLFLFLVPPWCSNFQDSEGYCKGKKAKELLGVRDESTSKTSTSRTSTTSTTPRDVSRTGKIWIQLAEEAEYELLGVSVIEQLPGLPAMTSGLE